MSDESALKPDGDVADWFATAMLTMAEAHGSKLTEPRTRIYAAELADLPRWQVEAAFRRCRRDGSGFFASIPELRKAALGTQDDAALLAWSGFERAAREIGGYSSLDVEDPAAAEALMMAFAGGWIEFCGTEPGPDLHVKRQAFLAAFRAARRRLDDVALRMSGASASPMGTVRLAGICEASGNYRTGAATWRGLLTADGRVRAERETVALPAAHSVKQLTTTGDDDGEKDGGRRQDTEGGKDAEVEAASAADDGRPRDSGVARRGRRPARRAGGDGGGEDRRD